MRKLYLYLAILCVNISFAQAEQFYKWKDVDGAWHYTTTPPPKGVEGQEVKLKALGADSDAADVMAENKAPSPEESAAKAAAELAVRRQEACERANKNVVTIKTSATVAVDKDGDGFADKELTSDEMEAQLKRAEAQVTLYCEDADSKVANDDATP